MTFTNDENKKIHYLFCPLSMAGNTLVAVADATQLLSVEKHFGVDKFTSMGVKDGDNPIVFLYKLK